MLEVLDPEQNATFRDNYLNVDFDLSNVLFIATSNVTENIPAALRDRMEMINISGYTQNDKVLISRAHLIDRQIENNGIDKNQIEFTDEGLFYLITHHTREAGLRNLEREIGSLCRKVAKNVVYGHKEKVIMTPEKITELLGAPRFIKEESLKESQIGVVTGLAWTQAGGEILYIEALKMTGNGQLKLTGQLGDVMKESALAAMSYAKAHHHELDIPEKWFTENDVHVHIPAGAIPKDGPSAGITMSTALISLMTGTPVRKDIAMTGEVTLTGRVLPVGGIKEKVLAALNHEIYTVILPMANQKDIADVPEIFKKKMKFIFVENVDEVLALALENNGKPRKSKKGKKKTNPSTAEAA
jgi:ATP-dependent Lon protease